MFKKVSKVLNIIALVTLACTFLFSLVSLIVSDAWARFIFDMAKQSGESSPAYDMSFEAIRATILAFGILGLIFNAGALLLSIMSLGRMTNGDSTNIPFILMIVCGAIATNTIASPAMIVGGIFGLISNHHMFKQPNQAVEKEEPALTVEESNNEQNVEDPPQEVVD